MALYLLVCYFLQLHSAKGKMVEFSDAHEGLGTGGILFPLVLPPIIAAVGVAKAVRYMAIIVVGILVPVIPFYKGRLPQTRTYIQGPTPRGARGRSHPLWKPSFLAFLVVNLIQSLAHFLPLTWLPSAYLSQHSSIMIS